MKSLWSLLHVFISNLYFHDFFNLKNGNAQVDFVKILNLITIYTIGYHKAENVPNNFFKCLYVSVQFDLFLQVDSLKTVKCDMITKNYEFSIKLKKYHNILPINTNFSDIKYEHKFESLLNVHYILDFVHNMA